MLHLKDVKNTLENAKDSISNAQPETVFAVVFFVFFLLELIFSFLFEGSALASSRITKDNVDGWVSGPTAAAASASQTKRRESPQNHSDHQHFWDKSKEGWFWYKDDIIPDEEEDDEDVAEAPKERKEEEPPSEITHEYLNSLTASQLRELGEQAMEVAVSLPTRENVFRYQFIQKFMVDRSETFAKTWVVNLLEHPELVGRERSSVSSASRTVFHNTLMGQNKEAIQDLSETAALIHFYDPQCPFCEKMKPILNLFEKKHNWFIKRININEEPDLALSFGVESVPDTWIIYKNPNDLPFYYRVRAGFTSKDELEEAILFLYQNIIMNPEINAEGPGKGTSGNIKPISSGVPNRPLEYVK